MHCGGIPTFIRRVNCIGFGLRTRKKTSGTVWTERITERMGTHRRNKNVDKSGLGISVRTEREERVLDISQAII